MRMLAEPQPEKPSLYKQKIVGIIQGLQQSLGAIASKVQSVPGQESLVESALIAQRLAQITQHLKRDTSEAGKSMRRSSSKQGRDSLDMSKNYYKTIESSIEQPRETKGNHFRTRSDATSSFLRYKSHAIIPQAKPNQDQVSRFCSSAVPSESVKQRKEKATIENKL